MLLLFDVGNTNTHIGLANARRIVRQMDVPTASWFNGSIRESLLEFVDRNAIEAAALCSVVPKATPLVLKAVWQLWKRDALELTPRCWSAPNTGIWNPSSAAT